MNYICSEVYFTKTNFILLLPGPLGNIFQKKKQQQQKRAIVFEKLNFETRSSSIIIKIVWNNFRVVTEKFFLSLYEKVVKNRDHLE